MGSAVRQGVIRRLARGMYDFPKEHPVLGPLAPSAEAIARAMAGRDHTRLQVAAAYAANALGLSEQVPANIVFLTDGPARTVNVGPTTIQLRRTTSKNMETAGRLSGRLNHALRELGQDHVTPARIAHLSMEEAHANFDAWKGRLAPRRLAILGGQPPLNPNLVQIVEMARDPLVAESREELAEFIRRLGTTMIFCDGGNKPAQAQTVTEIAKPGDLIAAHDCAPNREIFASEINGKPWNWCEITDADLLAIDLCSVDLAKLREAMWFCGEVQARFVS